MKAIGSSIRGKGVGCGGSGGGGGSGSGTVTGGSTDAEVDPAGAGSTMCCAADFKAFETVCKWEVKTDEQALRLVGLRTRTFSIHY